MDSSNKLVRQITVGSLKRQSTEGGKPEPLKRQITVEYKPEPLQRQVTVEYKPEALQRQVTVEYKPEALQRQITVEYKPEEHAAKASTATPERTSPVRAPSSESKFEQQNAPRIERAIQRPLARQDTASNSFVSAWVRQSSVALRADDEAIVAARARAEAEASTDCGSDEESASSPSSPSRGLSDVPSPVSSGIEAEEDEEEEDENYDWRQFNERTSSVEY